MVERKESKSVYRLIPCPPYDVSGTECWLTDMAKQGYWLGQDGFFAGIVTFEKTTPQNVIYRLQPAEKSTSMWAAKLLRLRKKILRGEETGSGSGGRFYDKSSFPKCYFAGGE